MNDKRKTEFIIEPGRQDIVMKRVFDAPRDVVFEAYTDPANFSEWWGPRNLKTVVDRAEIKPGGRWRFLNIERDGTEHAFRGVYHDVVAPELLIYTFEYEPMAGEVALEKVMLEELDGATQYTSVTVYSSVEGRDQMAESGMEEGAGETMDRFAELLERIQGQSDSDSDSDRS
jgi:uncharacterized protein YndB with AHSA1/START domain